MYGIGGAERLPHGLPSRKINRIYIDLAMSRSKIKMSEHTTCFLLEHYSLVAPLRVCQLVVAANRVSETPFNTPEHYANLEAKRARKLKRKAEAEAECPHR